MRAWFIWLGASPLFPALSVFISVAIGALVTWFVARLYYQAASKDLTKEADALHRATSLVVSFLENPEIDKTMLRDEKGRVVGMAAGMRASGRLSISGSATLTDGNAQSP